MTTIIKNRKRNIHVTVNLDEGEAKLLDQFARSIGTSRGVWLRMAIYEAKNGKK